MSAASLLLDHVRRSSRLVAERQGASQAAARRLDAAERKVESAFGRRRSLERSLARAREEEDAAVDRFRAAAAVAVSTRGGYEVALEQRRRAIAHAVRGFSLREVGRAASLSPSHIWRISKGQRR